MYIALLTKPVQLTHLSDSKPCRREDELINIRQTLQTMNQWSFKPPLCT